VKRAGTICFNSVGRWALFAPNAQEPDIAGLLADSASVRTAITKRLLPPEPLCTAAMCP